MVSKGRMGILAALLLAICAPLGPAYAATTAQLAIEYREETLAYQAGMQGFVYGYPAVDYMALMRMQTTPGAREYAPMNSIFNQGRLMGPGDGFVGRAPNNDTIYFNAWLDLRSGPVMIKTPAIPAGRYHSLTFADFYSEVQHTGAGTTGNGAQTIWVAGPDWKGRAPAGVHFIRMRTRQALVLGRMLALSGSDEAVASKLVAAYRVIPPASAATLPELDLPPLDAVKNVAFFGWLNQFLRANPRLPGEESLMALFDAAGFGPSVQFDETRLSPAARRGLERALVDGRKLIMTRRFTGKIGWTTPTDARTGTYGYDYLQRAYLELIGLLANRPEESVYPGLSTDAKGEVLTGAKTYRLRFAPNATPPTNAFWSLTAYDAKLIDLIPNPINRFSIGDRTKGLTYNADGSLEIVISKSRPREGVNWLPVGEGQFFLSMRIYLPKAEVLAGRYKLPDLEIVE